MGQITPATRAIVWERCGGICEVCGAARAQNLHHRRGKGMGGTRRAIHSPAWILAVCGFGNTSGCHGRIESDRPGAEAAGWALPWSVDDPTTVPVLLAIGRVHLDDAGGYTLAA
jgi:5-methylcytosine-specific restriction protein A